MIRDFTTTILRGDRVGVIGPNGSGKTTLLRVLLGEVPPRTGTVRLGTRLSVAYSDQLREGLDEERTVAENLGDGGDTVTVNGRPRHVIGYLQDVLFSPDRARSPVRVLSGRGAESPAAGEALHETVQSSSSSTNRRTTWTSRPWTCWKTSSWSTRAPSSS